MKKHSRKKCDHLQDALQLYRKDIKETKARWGNPFLVAPTCNVGRYSSIKILYETKKGRVVNCFLCGQTWYTQAKYSKSLFMQR